MPFVKSVIATFAVVLLVLSNASFASEDDGKKFVVALDPGHGGIDPGAVTGSLSESNLVMDFANRLKAELEETGQFLVVLTRDSDVAVPLDKRLTIARDGGAEVFISIHADSLAPGTGQASGLTVYTLDDADIARANNRLVERHGSRDILTDVDLNDAGDDVRRALISLARQEAQPRSRSLAHALLSSFESVDVATNNRPHRHAGFAVLKAAEMPSVLIELGFLSNARDLAKLGSDEWLQEAADAIRDGLLLWQLEDRVFHEQVLK